MKYRVVFEFRNERGEWVEEYLDNNGDGFNADDALKIANDISRGTITTRFVRYEPM